MFIHTQLHQQQVSRNAKLLSEKLVEVIRAAKESNETLSYMDVCQATLLTNSTLREELGGTSRRTHLLIALGLLVGLTVAVVLLAVLNS